MVRFTVVGAATIALDWLAYFFLLHSELFAIEIAKGVSFLAGSVFAFLANRTWVFRSNLSRYASLWRFALLYSLSMLTNIYLNKLLLTWLELLQARFVIAFLVATFFSAGINFFGMKFFVFPLQRG